MKITNVRMNGIVNPVGFTFDRMVCSWCVEGSESKPPCRTMLGTTMNETSRTARY